FLDDADRRGVPRHHRGLNAVQSHLLDANRTASRTAAVAYPRPPAVSSTQYPRYAFWKAPPHDLVQRDPADDRTVADDREVIAPVGVPELLGAPQVGVLRLERQPAWRRLGLPRRQVRVVPPAQRQQLLRVARDERPDRHGVSVQPAHGTL